MEWVLTGLAFGFLGSFHCLGMCGPLALALPGGGRKTSYLVVSRLVYNIGRVITYAMLGLAVGLLSRMVAISGFQRWLSITVGLLMLSGLAVSAFRAKLNKWKAYPSRLIKKTMGPLKSLFKKGTIGSLFLIGLLNGLLPCGFVYMGLATALTTGAVLSSVFFMVGFGFGTFPAMLGISLAGGFMSLSLRRWLRQISPYFIALVGVLLIIRGLGLGIPFLSPNL